MKELTPKQREMWNYIRDYTVEYGCSPTFAEIAEHFSVSTAAVSNMLKTIEENRGIKRLHRKRSIALLNEDGSIYDPAEDEKLKLNIPAELIVPERLPEKFRKLSDDNTVFEIADDQMSNACIRQGDILEFTPVPDEPIPGGSLICVRYGNYHFLRIYTPNEAVSGIRHLIPEHLVYNGLNEHCTITGILKRAIRPLIRPDLSSLY